MERLHSLAFHAAATPEPSTGLSVIHASCIQGDCEIIRIIFSFSPSLVDSLIALTVPVKKSSSKYDGMKPEQILEVMDTEAQQKSLNFIKETVTCKATEYKSLIHFAAEFGTCHHIRRLVQQGTNIEAEQVYLDDYLSENYAGFEMLCNPFHITAAYNTVEVMEELVHQGANVLTKSNDKNEAEGYSAAHFSAKYGNTSVLLYLMEKEGCLRDLVCRGFTPLHLATCEGHLETVAALIDSGANVNEESYGYLPVGVECYSTTPCMIAAFKGHLKTLELLIEKGGNIHAVDELGRSLLFYAVMESQTEVFRKLISLGLSPNCDDSNRQTLLHEVSNPDIAELLLSHGVAVDARNNFYQTPLHVAAGLCNIKVMKILVSHQADINAQDSNADTPLAISGNFVFDNIELKGMIREVIQFLVNEGADVNIVDSNGRTPLMIAIQNDENGDDKVQALLECGSNLSMVDRSGKTCMHHAKSLAIFQMLIERGVKYTAVDNDGNTVLHMAAARCDMEMISFLLEHDRNKSIGAEVNDKEEQFQSQFVNVANNKGQSALHIVSKNCRDKGIVEILLQWGSDINMQDGTGRTALHYATERGSLDFVTVLLNNGSDPRIVEYSLENTALHSVFATASSSVLVVEKLLNDDIKRREDTSDKEETSLPQVLNKKWQSALHLAAKRGQVDIIQVLLDAGCDMHAKDRSGKTPVMYSSKHPDALKFFKDRGGQIKPPYKGGKAISKKCENG